MPLSLRMSRLRWRLEFLDDVRLIFHWVVRRLQVESLFASAKQGESLSESLALLSSNFLIQRARVVSTVVEMGLPLSMASGSVLQQIFREGGLVRRCWPGLASHAV